VTITRQPNAIMHSDATSTREQVQSTKSYSDSQVIRNRVVKYLEIALIEDDSPELVRDTDRVDNYGEVFTPNWLVKQMLDYMPNDPVADLNKSALDPSCGNGQFLTEGLRRKLVTAARLFADSLDYEQYQYNCLRALSKIYGIDINADTAGEARRRMATIVFKAYEAVTSNKPGIYFSVIVEHILHKNIVVADFLADSYCLIEWIPHEKYLFERKIWPANVIFSKKSQRGTLFEDIVEPSEVLPPLHWKSIAGSEH